MPDMSKCFSHHTNRENPLTHFERVIIGITKGVTRAICNEMATIRNSLCIYALGMFGMGKIPLT